LDDLPGTFSVTAVRGPFIDGDDQTTAAASDCRRVVDLLWGPDTLRDPMLKADLAISAGGHTLYELAATGTPAVAVETADNQAENVRAMATQGSVCAVGRADDPSVIAACEAALRRIFEDREARRAMSAAGQRVVDGRGAQRVAHAVA
jgi:spore coat polysaccharide biosynthesis predicted glycosyltransferase SpsG